MYTTIMQPPQPVVNCSADRQINVTSSMNGINVSKINGYLSPPSAMSTASCSSSTSSSSSSSPLSSSPESITNTVKTTLALLATSTPPASSASSSSSSSSASSNPTTPNSHQLISNLSPANLNAAAAALNSDSVSSMFHPLRELQHYMAKIEEDKDKLRTDLITYSRFNCVLENIKRSFYKGFTALQCVDRNKSCRCNEHLNIHLRRVVQDADIELGIWQQQYDKLVLKYNADNGQQNGLNQSSNSPNEQENPLRHLNAALIGTNDILFPPDSPNDHHNERRHSNGNFADQNRSASNHSQLHNLSYFHHSHSQPDNKVSNGKASDTHSRSSHSPSDADPCHNSNPNGTSRLSHKGDSSPERTTENGLAPPHPTNHSHHHHNNHAHHPNHHPNHSHSHHAHYQNEKILKSSYNNMTTLNFSPTAFLKSDKSSKLLTNGHARTMENDNHERDEEEDEEEAGTSPPPLIPPPINGMLNSNECKLLAQRLTNGDSGWNPNKYSQLNGHCDLSANRNKSESRDNHSNSSAQTNAATTNSDLNTATTALKCLNLLKTTAVSGQTDKLIRNKESMIINNNFESTLTKTKPGEFRNYINKELDKENNNVLLVGKEPKVVSEPVVNKLSEDGATVAAIYNNNCKNNAIGEVGVNNKSSLEKLLEKKDSEQRQELLESVSEDSQEESGSGQKENDTTRFECDWPDCSQTFESEEILIHHRRCHIRKSNYLCKHCSARLLSREEMDQHVLNCASKSGRKAKSDLEAANAESNRSPKSSDDNSDSNNKTDENEENLRQTSSSKRNRTEDVEVVDEEDDDEEEERRSKGEANRENQQRSNPNQDPHSSEEEIEVEEVTVLKFGRDRSRSDSRNLKLSSLLEGAKSASLSSDDEHQRNSGESHSNFGSNLGHETNGSVRTEEGHSSRRSSGASSIDELSNYARYACSADMLLYPNKRQKSYTISTPSASSYMPNPNHLAAFYPHLAAQNGSLLSSHHPMSPMDLTALMESGRLSPLTLSMLAQQHQQNQHRFQQYFAAAAAQHHLQQQQQQPVPSNQSPASPPPSPTGAENLTLPNSARSSNFSASSGSANPFSYHRSSSMSGLMGPPQSTIKQQNSTSSGRNSSNILSSRLGSPQPSQDRVSSSPSSGPNVPNGLSHSQSQSHMFSPPISANGLLSHQSPSQSNLMQRAYTISTPGSFSALAALAAAASSASSPTSHPSPNASANASPGSHPHSLSSGLHFPLLPPQHHSPNPMSSMNGTSNHINLTGNPSLPFGSTSGGQSLHHQSKGSSFPAFDLHHRSSSSRQSPLGSPVSNPSSLSGSVPPSSNRSLHQFYAQSQQNSGPHQQVAPCGPNLNGSGPGSSHHHHLLNNSSSQNQLAMIAAAAAAAADNARCHPMGGPGHLGPVLGGNGSEATRLTAAALASLGALKHHTSPGPVGEYKRTRYSGIGRYRCPWPDCGYTPHFLRDLRRHMFKHTGDKKHKCDYPGCDFVSVWKTSLLQHQRKKHYGVSSSITLRTNNHGNNSSNNNNSAAASAAAAASAHQNGGSIGNHHHHHSSNSLNSHSANSNSSGSAHSHHPSRPSIIGPIHCNDSAVVAGAGI